MTLPGLVAANNLNDIVDQEKAWDNLGNNILAPNLPDIFYSNVSLLLHGNGTNGSTTITDNSPTPKTVTAFGNAQISTAQSKFGGTSIAFDGAGDYLTIPSSDDFTIGTQDFTIEGWAWIVSGAANFPQLFSIQSTDALFVNFRGGLVLGLTDFGIVYATSPTTPSGEWFHFAVTRSNSLARFFVNGISGSPGTCTKSFGAISQTGAAIGLGNTGTFNGYIDELRVTKGVARYTANFTPPDKAFYDLSNNSFIDSTLTITGRDILALNAVRNTSTRDFIFIKGLLSSVQPRLTTAAQQAASGTTLRDLALLRNAPSSEGDYFVPRGVFDGGTIKINGIQAASLSSSPFSGSTALFPISIRTMELSSNFRLATTFPSGTIASPERAIPIEATSLVLYAKAGQS